MARSPGKLLETTKPDGYYVQNGFGMIEGSVVYLDSQIGNWQTSLDPKNV